MKFLIIGCNGMAGHMISLYLKEQGYNVIGYAREQSRFIETVIGDAVDFEFLKKTVINGDYDCIVNCVGLLNQFAENNHPMAILLNSFLPHYLAQVTEETKTQVIQISTDCVFSGKTGGYTEDSVPDGTLFYDRSKAMGEIRDKKNITIRSSIVGPDIKENGIGLLNWFLQQDSAVNGFIGAIWTGQTTLQLAKTVEEASKCHAYGLYNAVPNETRNKYELLKLFNTYIRREQILINPVDKFVADKSLIRTKFEGFDYVIPGYEIMIKELGDWMREHKELYPHYDL